MKNKRFLNGYVVIYEPDHASSMKSKNWRGYVYEHRFVVEKSIGRCLDKNEVVHHINGDKKDNRLCNLEILTRSSHAKHHVTKTKEKRCETCGKVLKNKRSSRCRKCRGIYSRKVERPSKQTLMNEIENESFVSLGKKYGVSDNAVRKWAKAYGII